MPTAPRPPLDDETVRFLLSGLSVSVSSCDDQLRPSLCRACGIRIADDRRTLHLLLVAAQAQRLVADIRRHGRAAAVFSDVDSHRTLQIKSASARVEAAVADDLAAAAQHQLRFEGRLDRIGFPPPFARALLGPADGERVVVVLAPDDLYTQTPGPHAGTRLRAPGAT